MPSLQSCWQNRHRLAIAAAVVMAVSVPGIAVVLFGNFDEKRRFAAVALGMTKEQVLAEIGKPPGEYGPPGARYGFPMVAT
jgi:outer membrane protein assembly factor BamE (lipoprotein component of BamABCDE complex)